MKTRNVLPVLLLCCCATVPCVAQDYGEVFRSTSTLDSKLDLLSKRLQSIEDRLNRLEIAVRSSANELDQNNRNVSPLIRWSHPQQQISPAIDAGMLFDAIERAQNRKVQNLDDPFQTFQKRDGVLIQEPNLKYVPQTQR